MQSSGTSQMVAAGLPDIHLNADTVAELVLFVLLAVAFWWGFIGSARLLARSRFGGRGLLVLGSLAAAGLLYAQVGAHAGVQMLVTWMLLWGAIAVWIRFGFWGMASSALGWVTSRMPLVRWLWRSLQPGTARANAKASR
jgi:hypothetical protein